MSFEPIAITGRGCVLPGALNPVSFWNNINSGHVSISGVPDDRLGLAGTWTQTVGTGAWADAGGYVQGFDRVFDPTGFALPPTVIAALDPLQHWVLYCAREALQEAGLRGPLPRAGLILGNLSYPTPSLIRYAEHVWLEHQLPQVRRALAHSPRGPTPHPWNRFSSGLPAHLAAQALALGAGGFALDAACASALYAIKIACDRLHRHDVDTMIAGAVNRGDGLLVHAGFGALSAMSPTGRSRPFSRDADGLVPAEGAVLVVLRRLTDAVKDDAPILGVIKGIGLSNDGRAGGLLNPAETGQQRAMREAYRIARVSPLTVTLAECHATGTPTGDPVEIRAMASVFAGCSDLPIGSAKANLGHLITAAGAVGLLKVLGAMHAGVRPATPGSGEVIAELAGTGLRVLHEPEPWPGPQRAAISAFGFGGNNAHMIVDSWPGQAGGSPQVPRPRPTAQPEPVAVVALSVRVADSRSTSEFTDALQRGTPLREPRGAVHMPLAGLRFPPQDLLHAEAQQSLLLEAATEALEGVHLPGARTIVLAGMGCSPDVARFAAGPRAAVGAAEAGIDEPDLLRRIREAFAPPLNAAAAVGTMPNMVANRINTQFDITGPGYTVSAEEASGLVALDLAAAALRSGEADAAIVGAVDLSCEIVHTTARQELGLNGECGDAAVVLVLKRRSVAQRCGDTLLALLEEQGDQPAGIRVGPVGEETPGFDPRSLFGSAHAADGLLAVATAIQALRYRMLPRPNAAAMPWLDAAVAEVAVQPLQAPQVQLRLRRGAAAGLIADPPPEFHIYSGHDRSAVIAALDAEREAHQGPARLVIVSSTAAELVQLRRSARDWLEGRGPKPVGVAFRTRPIDGDIAFVFASGAAAYPGMGRDLIRAFPTLADQVDRRVGPLSQSLGWAYRSGRAAPDIRDRMSGATALAALHTEVAGSVLGLQAQAALGHSSGEYAALAALGAWRNPAAVFDSARKADLFTRQVSGDYAAVHTAWRQDGITGGTWANYLVAAGAPEVEAALAAEPAVHLMAINAPDSCSICGDDDGCGRVIQRLGNPDAIALSYDLAIHAPELKTVSEQWRHLYRQPTWPVPETKFYSCATRNTYPITPDAVADALTKQALTTVDFAGTIEQAWADGARIFIEHGPQKACTTWIDQILADHDHVAVALDAPRRNGIRQLAYATAELLAAGVAADHHKLTKHLLNCRPPTFTPGETFTLPAHRPPVHLPDLDPEPQELPLPPKLPFLLPAPPTFTPPTPTQVRAAPAAWAATQTVAHWARSTTRAHKNFLTMQAQAHADFLRFQDAAVRALHAARPIPASRALNERATTPEPPPAPAAPVVFTRAQLEHLATGKISDLFGPLFAAQDAYPRQTRLPQPPLLMVDRVTHIDAEPATMGTGTILTETDIAPGAWYLDPAGRIAISMLVEAGQADLLLISWLGVDLINRGERVYRLLGCELTFHQSPPLAGTTLTYEISIDGHAVHHGTRLFYFRYECRAAGKLVATMRDGQAGFFTDAELAEPAGIGWDPFLAPYPTAGDFKLPATTSRKHRFSPGDIRAFSEGNPAECFGREWLTCQAHLRTPRIHSGKMLLLHEITEFDPLGGPWGRGYLRAETPITPGTWFFEPHFKNDPCMPGTVMLEGCIQAMAFHLTALGFTIERDGWRFEPVREQPYTLRCRSQVTPENSALRYELFVSDVTAGPHPTLQADVLCSVDGVQALHVRNFRIALVPDPVGAENLVHVMRPGGRPAPAQASRRQPPPEPEHQLPENAGSARLTCGQHLNQALFPQSALNVNTSADGFTVFRSCAHHMAADLRKRYSSAFAAPTLSAICPCARAFQAADRTHSHGHCP